MRQQQTPNQKYIIKDDSKVRIQGTKQSLTFQNQGDSTPTLQPILSHHMSAQANNSTSQSLQGIPIAPSGNIASAAAKILHQPDHQSQMIYDLMNLQNQKTAAIAGQSQSAQQPSLNTQELSGSGAAGNQPISNHAMPPAGITNRRDFKISLPVSMSGRHSQPRSSVASILKNHQKPIQNNQQSTLYNNGSGGDTITGIVGTALAVPNLVNQNSSAGPNYSQHYEDFTNNASSGPMMHQTQSGLPNSTTGQFFRQQALSSLGNPTSSVIGSGGLNSAAGMIGFSNLAPSPGQVEAQQHIAQLQQAMVFTNGFDPSDRSTTAGTSLPHLSTKSSFHTRHRGGGGIQTVTQMIQNIGALTNQIESAGSALIGMGNQIPQIGNTGVIGTQQSIKHRQMPPRRHYKIVNTAQTIQQTFSNQNDEDSSQIPQYPNRQKQNQQNPVPELQAIQGQSLIPQNIGPLRSSPLELFKSETKLPSQIQQTVQFPNNNSNTNERNSSPVLNPLQLKARLSSFNPTPNDPSPSTSIGIVAGVSVIQTQPGQFYAQNQSNPYNQGNEPNIESTPLSLQTSAKRDIKIRKVNPNLQKNSLRFQTAQHILNTGNISNPSPLTITSFNSGNNAYINALQNSNIQSTPNNLLIPLSSKRLTENNNDIKRRPEELFPIATQNTQQKTDLQPTDPYANIPEGSQWYPGNSQKSTISENTSKIIQQINNQNASNRKQSEDSEVSIMPAPLSKAKATFATEDRKRKFTSHSKYQIKGKQSISNINFDPRLPTNQAKQENFSSIPNVIQNGALADTLKLVQQHSSNTNDSVVSVVHEENKQDSSPIEEEISFLNMQPQKPDEVNNSILMHLESYDTPMNQTPNNAHGPQIYSPKSKALSVIHRSGSNEVIIGGFTDQKQGGNQSILFRDGRPEDIEISGFEQDSQIPGIEQSPNQIDFMRIAKEEQKDKKKLDSADINSPRQMQANISSSNGGPTVDLDVIEEEGHDDTNKSQTSKLRNNNSQLRNKSNSLDYGGLKPQVSNYPINHSRHSNVVGSNITNNLSVVNGVNTNYPNTYTETPQMQKFKALKTISEQFNKISKKVLCLNINVSSVLNGTPHEELEKYCEELSKLSNNNSNFLTHEEIKSCVLDLKKSQQLRDKFQNPYIKRIRQRSIGNVSRSNDYLNYSHNQGSSSSVIEENIIIQTNLHSNSMISLNNNTQSLVLNYHGLGVNQAPQNFGAIGQQMPGSNNNAQINNNWNKKFHNPVNQINVRSNEYVANKGGGSGIEAIRFEDNLNKLSPVGAHQGTNGSHHITDSGSGSGPSNRKEKQSQNSFDSELNNRLSVGLSNVDIKRMQYSQKHQSHKINGILGTTPLSNTGQPQIGGSSNHNDTSSNSLIGTGLNPSRQNQHKVRSYQHQPSNDGSSQKSDPNQNRLYKLSSGSHTDSYYIPHSGESFHYQVPQRFITQRQSKSMARQGAASGVGHTLNINNVASNGQEIQNNNQIGGGLYAPQAPKPIFNDILNGQKAIMVDRIAAPQQEKIQGQLIKWREIKKIGQGTSGEVFLAQNIVKNAQPQYFVVKKISIFSPNSGIDKEAVVKLKKEIELYRKLNHETIVKYIGSEIVSNQFCIYLEYLSGGSIQANYQSHPQQKLPESLAKQYTKQILIGLTYLHENRIVHGDLKGANVLVDESKKLVKLTDFGCARLFESSISQSDMNGVIRGSLAWMAPEVLMNKGIRRKADIWSLGCLVIEMLVGGNPWGSELFQSDNNFQAMMKILDPNKSPVIPSDISSESQDFILRCLTREYDKRPTAMELMTHPWMVSLSTPSASGGSGSNPNTGGHSSSKAASIVGDGSSGSANNNGSGAAAAGNTSLTTNGVPLHTSP